jgi:hypothetical protein
MNDSMRLGLVAAAILWMPLAASAQQDSAPSTDESGLVTPSQLQPNYTPEGPVKLVPPPGAAPGAIVVITPSGGERTVRRRHRVSEIRSEEASLEARRGLGAMERGERQEFRGARLVAAGEKTGGTQGAKLEAEGKALERGGAHEVVRGARVIRAASSSGGRGGHAAVQARREARQAARGGGQSSVRSSATRQSAAAKAHDQWH